MEKREIIILVLTVGAALYGGLDYFILSGGKDEKPAVTNNETINAAMAQLSSLSGGINKEVSDLSAKLQHPWPEKIFFPKQASSLKEEAQAFGKPELQSMKPESLTYSGYLQMDAEKIAIINGSDYRSGDLAGPYTVAFISEDKVVLTLGEYSYDLPIKKME